MRVPLLKILALLLLAPAGGGAQVVRGQLMDARSGLPLEGAMIVLQGPAGEVGAVLSNASGRFLLRAPAAGSYTLRADRIGHASTVSDPFVLAVGDTVDVRMAAEVSPIRLEGLEVSGERRCTLRPEAGRAVAAVWEEARKALAAAALTEAADIYRYRTIRFVRELDETGRRILSEETQVSRTFQRTPFESLPAETLMAEGFIRSDPGGDLYFAPDARVLLSDAFLDTHCLNLTAGRGESAGLLGVGFEPLGGREVPEIRGVVWLDPATGELRRVDYTYENLDAALRSDAVGGRVAFRGLPDGNWIVTEWRIRMPNAALAPDFRGGRQLVLAGIREVGGSVDRIQDRQGNTILEAERATLAGAVLDETGLAPLTGARVTLVGTGTTALTDAEGRFRISGLGEGVYAVTFSHPRVPSLGGLPEPVEVALTPGSVTPVRLVAPPLSLLLERACGDAERPRGSAVLTGTVLDGETGEPLPRAVVRVLWTDYRFRGTAVRRGAEAGMRALMGTQGDGVQGPADDAGRYLACAVPADHPLSLEAEVGDLTSGILDVRIPADAPFLERDVRIRPSGTGSLQGLVVAMDDQGPLEGVRVSLEGFGTSTLSDRNGRFGFEEVPQGRHVLKAEMLGRRAVVDTVRIRPDRPLHLEVRLPPEAMEIEGLTVEVFSRAEMDVRTEAFTGATLDRLTPAEMDSLRHRVADIVDVLQSMGSPRIRITEMSPQGFPFGFCIRWSRRTPSLMHEQGGGGCPAMLIVVDGRPLGGGPQDTGATRRRLPASGLVLTMHPDDIESVQVLSPVQAQFRFGIDGGNGALVIETRRGARRERAGRAPTGP